MNLSELAFTCHCYGCITNNDEAYLQLLGATNAMPDLSNLDHRRALLKWLNQWNCRQFALEYHDLAQNELLDWFNLNSEQLFPDTKNMWEFIEDDYRIIRNLFESLMDRTASFQHRGDRRIEKKFCAIGAAKILFAIRPKCFIPWDGKIQEAFRYDTSPASYVRYIKKIKGDILFMKTNLEQNGFTLEDLPAILHRTNSSIPKIMDEYYWMTITRNWSIPDNETFRNWAQWINLI